MIVVFPDHTHLFFCNHLEEEERVCCFTFIVFLMYWVGLHCVIVVFPTCLWSAFSITVFDTVSRVCYNSSHIMKGPYFRDLSI